MAWSTAISDLRSKLFDNPTDRLRAFKRVFGQCDGTNKTFKTFEFRRVTDLTGAEAPLGVYKNGVVLPSSDIASDDLSTGFFNLSTAPADGDVIECTYYVQYFNDDELNRFLRLASNFLGFGDAFTNIDSPLQTAALMYSCHEAYNMLSNRFNESMADTYRLQDMPDEKRKEMAAEYSNKAKTSLDDAIKIRNDFYERQGKQLTPSWGFALGTVRDVAPNR